MPTIISKLTGAKLKVLPTEFLTSNQTFSMTKEQIEHWKDTLIELDTIVPLSHKQNINDLNNILDEMNKQTIHKSTFEYIP